MDDSPSFSSASNSPIPALAGSVLDDAEVTSRLDAEYRQAHKLDKPRLPFKVCDSFLFIYYNAWYIKSNFVIFIIGKKATTQRIYCATCKTKTRSSKNN